jgi:hypothetical protein
MIGDVDIEVCRWIDGAGQGSEMASLDGSVVGDRRIDQKALGVDVVGSGDVSDSHDGCNVRGLRVIRG